MGHEFNVILSSADNYVMHFFLFTLSRNYQFLNKICHELIQKRKKATNTGPCIYQTHLSYAVASSVLNAFLCKEINLNKMSLRIQIILEACIAVTLIFFYIHQNEVYHFFLISQHFNLYWWTLKLFSHYYPKCFVISTKHSTACSSCGYSKQPQENKIFFFPCSCQRCLQISPFLPLVLYKECNHSCASSAHRNDQNLEVVFFLGGKDCCVLCTSAWLLLSNMYLVNVKCHASFKWLKCWETALKAVKPAKVGLLRHDLSLKNPFSQKLPQIANSLLGLSDQFLFIE